MTRKSCTFVVTLLTLVASLVTLAWAQAPAGGFEQFWGPNYTYPTPPSIAARQPSPPNPSAANAMHHWNHVAIDSAGLDHTPVPAGDPRIFGEQLGPGRSAARWPSFTSPCSTRSMPSRGAIEATPAFPTRRAGPRWMPRSPRRRTTRWSRCIPSQKAHCDEVLAERLAKIARQPRQDRRHPRRPARRTGDPGAQAPTTGRSTPSRCSGTTSSRAIFPASGARIPSASSRSRLARIGVRSRRSSFRTSTRFRVPPPPA